MQPLLSDPEEGGRVQPAPDLAGAGLAGLTLIEVSTAALTVRLAVPETPFSEAETVVEPVATAVNSPAVPSELLMLASTGFVKLQCAEAVTSCDVPSVKDAVAVKFAV